ncbi:MAG: type II toxin-antitoxin system HicA family toxin [Dehalococcoidia bacterium]
MTRLPRISGQEMLRVLLRNGYDLTHVRGSHHYLRKPGLSGLVVVPIHGGKDLPIGTLQSILRQAGLTPEDFVALHND